MSDDSMIDDDEAGLAVIGNAIRNLARRERKLNDLATLIAGGDFNLDIVASADADELRDAASDDDLAAALGFCAGLALQARQALRHYCGVTVETEARKGKDHDDDEV